MKTILRVFSYLRRYPRLALGQLGCALFGTLMVIVFPEITRRVIDEVIPQGRSEELIPLVIAGLAAFFARDLLNSMRIILNNTFEQKVIFDLRSDLYARIQLLPVRWFDQRQTGDIMTRVAEDVTAMERVLIDGIEQGAVAILQIGIVATVMVITDSRLALLAAIPIPFLMLGALLYTSTARNRYRLIRQSTSEMNTLLHDNIAGIRQIKAYTMEEDEHESFNEASNRVRRATLKVMFAWAIYHPGMNFLSAVGFVIVIGFGGNWALQGELAPGELAAFLLLLNLFYDPIGKLHALNQLLQSGRAAAERVFEILDTEEEIDGGSRSLPVPIEGRVEFHQVSFSYSENRRILSGIDLVAQPGETVALVGPTGAGKSTIINLLTRFYEAGSGEITIDRVPINEIPKRDLRQTIGYVTQESFLFDGTVRQNLLIARRTAEDGEMWKALEVANAADFVRGLPDGLDTWVGERGVRLSVGEKQRVSIARALLKNPPILLLDEATASVDTATERLIQQALDRLMANRTSFVIAHRLSTIRRADRIYVIEKGRVVEVGSHHQLVQQDGLYAALSRTAFLEEQVPGA